MQYEHEDSVGATGNEGVNPQREQPYFERQIIPPFHPFCRVVIPDETDPQQETLLAVLGKTPDGMRMGFVTADELREWQEAGLEGDLFRHYDGTVEGLDAMVFSRHMLGKAVKIIEIDGDALRLPILINPSDKRIKLIPDELGVQPREYDTLELVRALSEARMVMAAPEPYEELASLDESVSTVTDEPVELIYTWVENGKGEADLLLFTGDNVNTMYAMSHAYFAQWAKELDQHAAVQFGYRGTISTLEPVDPAREKIWHRLLRTYLGTVEGITSEDRRKGITRPIFSVKTSLPDMTTYFARRLAELKPTPVSLPVTQETSDVKNVPTVIIPEKLTIANCQFEVVETIPEDGILAGVDGMYALIDSHGKQVFARVADDSTLKKVWEVEGVRKFADIGSGHVMLLHKDGSGKVLWVPGWNTQMDMFPGSDKDYIDIVHLQNNTGMMLVREGGLSNYHYHLNEYSSQGVSLETRYTVRGGAQPRSLFRLDSNTIAMTVRKPNQGGIPTWLDNQPPDETRFYQRRKSGDTDKEVFEQLKMEGGSDVLTNLKIERTIGVSDEVAILSGKAYTQGAGSHLCFVDTNKMQLLKRLYIPDPSAAAYDIQCGVNTDRTVYLFLVPQSDPLSGMSIVTFNLGQLLNARGDSFSLYPNIGITRGIENISHEEDVASQRIMLAHFPNWFGKDNPFINPNSIHVIPSKKRGAITFSLGKKIFRLELTPQHPARA